MTIDEYLWPDGRFRSRVCEAAPYNVVVTEKGGPRWCFPAQTEMNLEEAVAHVKGIIAGYPAGVRRPDVDSQDTAIDFADLRVGKWYTTVSLRPIPTAWPGPYPAGANTYIPDFQSSDCDPALVVNATDLPDEVVGKSVKDAAVRAQQQFAESPFRAMYATWRRGKTKAETASEVAETAGCDKEKGALPEELFDQPFSVPASAQYDDSLPALLRAEADSLYQKSVDLRRLADRVELKPDDMKLVDEILRTLLQR